MSLINTIKKRRSVKAFQPKYNINQNKLNKILEAGRMAPSIYGLEPWFFLTIKNKSIIKKLGDIYMNQNNVQTSSCLIIILSLNQKGFNYFMEYKTKSRGEEHFPNNDLEKYRKYIINKDVIEKISSEQSFIALSFMMLAAEELNINTCPIAGFHKDKLKKYIKDNKLFKNIDYYDPAVSLVLGKKDNQNKPFKIRRRDNSNLIYKII